MSELQEQDIQNPTRSYSPKVTIQAGLPYHEALFCIPGAGASVTSFCDLAHSLGSHVPVYGLQPRGLDNESEPFFDVASAARCYASSICETSEHGPYRLLGHSFGGWVAFETAQLLIARGKRVAALIIIDSQVPLEPTNRPTRFSRMTTLLKLIRLFELRLDQPLGLTAADLESLDAEDQLALLLKSLIRARLFPPRAKIESLRGVVNVFEANINTDFAPSGPYAGSLYLISASQGIEPRDAEKLCALWRCHAPQAIGWVSPGNHLTMLMQPHVDALAQRLRSLFASDAANT